MRKLSESFMQELTSGFLRSLTERVRQDHDLDLQIRDNYLNIYFKGNSLLRLNQVKSGKYRVMVHTKFSGDTLFSDLTNEETVDEFIRAIPMIKDNILSHGKPSLEIEYEQMIIRANNYEPRNNSEYFIVDRQYAVSDIGRFDLTGIYWPRQRRKRHQVVQPCLMEVKFALNQDIQDVHQQLNRYYQAIQQDPADIAQEIESIFQQKLELGLYKQPSNRLAAMKTLKVSQNIENFLFILILVDYNPYSTLFHREKLSQLPFTDQVRIFRCGFGMWENNLKTLEQDRISRW